MIGALRFVAFKKVDKLVALSVLGAVLLTWGFLVGFDAFYAFVGEIGDVGTGGYTLSKAVTYTLLTVPRRGYQMFGNAALIGGLMGLGRFATIFTITLAVQPPALAWAFLVPGLIIHTTFGVLSGLVSSPLIRALARPSM